MRTFALSSCLYLQVLFYLVLADDIPAEYVPNRLANTWKIESLSLTRNGRRMTVENTTTSIDVQFQLYHPKWEPCTVIPPGQYGFGRQDLDLCVAYKDSNNPATCTSSGISVNGNLLPPSAPGVLWHPCTGRRWRETDCGNYTSDLDLMRRPACASGPIGIKDHEVISERGWVKWSVIRLEELPLPAGGIEHDPNKPITYEENVSMVRFRSVTLEVVSGQRYFPNGQSPPDGQIVLYSSRFTLLRNQMDCFTLRGPVQYSCSLEVSQLDPYMPRGHCLSKIFIFDRPVCGFRVPFEYRVISLDEFKKQYER